MIKPDYEWIAAGEEWSEPWGESAGQWFGSILPRIRSTLLANTILEIASGFIAIICISWSRTRKAWMLAGVASARIP